LANNEKACAPWQDRITEITEKWIGTDQWFTFPFQSSRKIVDAAYGDPAFH